jgi:hypothetical protein
MGPSYERTAVKPPPRVTDAALYQAAVKPKMIGIASSANVYAGSEIDRSQVQQFISLLTRLAIVANGTRDLLSYPSLEGIKSDTGQYAMAQRGPAEAHPAAPNQTPRPSAAHSDRRRSSHRPLKWCVRTQQRAASIACRTPPMQSQNGELALFFT